jgi:hypothetical protein
LVLEVANVFSTIRDKEHAGEEKKRSWEGHAAYKESLVTVSYLHKSK